MTETSNYVQSFQDQMSYKIRGKQPDVIHYPEEDYRLREKYHKTRLEPPSQIAKQSIFSNSTYHPDALQNFMKPLINYQITNEGGRLNGQTRYNHNYAYLGQRTEVTELKKEPFNQPQRDYQQDLTPQTQRSQNQFASPDSRNQLTQAGNMLIQQQGGSDAFKDRMAGNPSMYSPKYFSKDYSKPYYGSKALKNLVSSNLY